MKKKFISILFSCMLILTSISGCSNETETTEEIQADQTEASSGAEESNGGLKPYTPPVSFEAVSTDGENISSDVLKESRLTMVNVWATYCNPCLKEMPELGILASEYDPADFQIVGIISDVTEDSDEASIELAKSLIDETDAAYTHLFLNESLYYGLLTDVTAVPTTFFIDSDSKIVDTVVGAMDKEEWKEKIDGLLEELP